MIEQSFAFDSIIAQCSIACLFVFKIHGYLLYDFLFFFMHYQQLFNLLIYLSINFSKSTQNKLNFVETLITNLLNIQSYTFHYQYMFSNQSGSHLSISIRIFSLILAVIHTSCLISFKLGHDLIFSQVLNYTRSKEIERRKSGIYGISAGDWGGSVILRPDSAEASANLQEIITQTPESSQQNLEKLLLDPVELASHITDEKVKFKIQNFNSHDNDFNRFISQKINKQREKILNISPTKSIQQQVSVSSVEFNFTTALASSSTLPQDNQKTLKHSKSVPVEPGNHQNLMQIPETCQLPGSSDLNNSGQKFTQKAMRPQTLGSHH